MKLKSMKKMEMIKEMTSLIKMNEWHYKRMARNKKEIIVKFYNEWVEVKANPEKVKSVEEWQYITRYWLSK